MATEIKVPTLGESVTEATIGQWFRKEGEEIKADEPIVELETDKVTIEVPAPASGVLSKIAVADGETVEVGAVLGSITEGKVSDTTTSAGPDPVAQKAKGGKDEKSDKDEKADEAEKPAAKAEKKADEKSEEEAPASKKDSGNGEMPASPAAKKLLEEKGLSAGDVDGSGKRGQVLKEDVLAALEKTGGKSEEKDEAPKEARAPASGDDGEREERVRMTRLRQTIARRLKEAQDTAAMLTTFNEVDMTNVMAMRSDFKETFEKKHGVKLGFMGFFIKAAIQALKDVPDVNAEIDGTDIVYKNYYHIGVAVGTERGLVVPVVKDADRLSIADIEKTIGDFGKRARDGQLKIDEMQGGTFTLSNGGVYGSLMSTPILNAPQSGILGMHKIQQRPMVVDGGIEARPMMYLALSYDHRIVDGKDAVTFLVRLKEAVEDPQRLILDL